MILFTSGLARLSACIAGIFLLTTCLLHVWQVHIEHEDIMMMNVGYVLRNNMILSNHRPGGQEPHQASWYHHSDASTTGTTIRSRERIQEI
jgi:hypothetical protein